MNFKSPTILILGILFAVNTLQAQEVETKQAPTDSVYLFKSDEGTVTQDSSSREIGSHIKHVQITNFSGKPTAINLSLDLKKWTNFTIQSPEKKVFVCTQINMMYVIIAPKSKRPIRKKIYRDKKYELFYNNSLKTVDIKEIVKKK